MIIYFLLFSHGNESFYYSHQNQDLKISQQTYFNIQYKIIKPFFIFNQLKVKVSYCIFININRKHFLFLNKLKSRFPLIISQTSSKSSLSIIYILNQIKKMTQQSSGTLIQTLNMQSIQQQLLQNDSFIDQLRQKLSSHSSISLSLQSKINQQQRRQSEKSIKTIPSYKNIKKIDLDYIIQQISELLNQLISQKLQYQMNEIIQENNLILEQIKQNLLLQQKENQSVLNQHNQQNQILQDDKIQISFSDVHKLIAEEKRKFQGPDDAGLQKSISCLVDFKFQSFQEKVANLDKRLKSMEDKYQTNLKSIWNVLSMTEGAVFEFINKEKQKEKENLKGKKQSMSTEVKSQINKKTSQKTQKKSAFFNLW